MGETNVSDPVFGRLVWDGFHHEGWGGSFVDEEFLSWGKGVRAVLPDDEDDEDDEDEEGDVGAGGGTGGAQEFLSQLLSIAGAEVEQDERAREMIRAARGFAKRVDEYDGSLDAGPLRRSGRLKVVVRNGRETPPTEAQRKAWRAFRDGGKGMAERVAAALLEEYRRQRPVRVRWWKAVYGDSPDGTLPDVRTTTGMRDIVQVKEVRVYGEQAGRATVAVVLEAFWCDKDVKVSVRDGKVVGVDRLEFSRGITKAAAGAEEMESPVFGRLRRASFGGGWVGVFHSDHLRGWDEASQTRYRFKEEGHFRGSPYRPGPEWESVTGDFELEVDCEEGERPSAAQEAAFRAFNADPAATARVVLSGILEWYREIRPKWVKNMNGSRERIESVMPDLRTPEGLLEIIELQSVTVMAESKAEPATGPREVTLAFGPKAGQKITLPPKPAKKAGVAIVLSFHWEDEHGLAVRWRDGQVEKVGSWESVMGE